MLRVLICDDHPIFREGLKKTLSFAPDLRVVGEAGTAAELFQILGRTPCDVLILDITLPDRNGLDILKQLQAEGRGPAAIVLSMHTEEQYAVRAIRAGARGYLEKAGVPNELIAALHKVAGGGVYVSPSLAERLARELSGQAEKPPHETLSNREYQILLMLAAGRGGKQIGAELKLRPTTIATYRRRILTKLKLNSTAELIHFALEQHLM